MFGPLEVRLEGRRLGGRDFDGVKPKQLLELLLLERGRLVPKDRAADLLWGERPPRRAAVTIETYVSLLRRRLDSGSDLGRRLILTEPGGYRLAADALEVDLDSYEALLRQAAVAAPADRRTALETAVEMGRLDLLGDEPYAPWVIPTREQYRERQVQALVDLAECCLDLGDHGAALAAAEAALALEPTRERAFRTAMRAHHGRGDRAAALLVYERCRRTLREELGVIPSPQTVELHLAIMRDEEAADSGPIPIAYARNGSVRIAYQTVGQGRLDLVFSPSHVSNLGATWDDPTYSAFLRGLAAMSRLILFDKRGTGLSDPALDSPTTRERSEDLVAVLDTVGSERAVLFGVCGGAALCAQLAADHPDRVAGLVLHNAMARMLVDEGYPGAGSPSLRPLPRWPGRGVDGQRRPAGPAQSRARRQPPVPGLVRPLRAVGLQPLDGPPSGRDERRARRPPRAREHLRAHARRLPDRGRLAFAREQPLPGQAHRGRAARGAVGRGPRSMGGRRRGGPRPRGPLPRRPRREAGLGARHFRAVKQNCVVAK